MAIAVAVLAGLMWGCASPQRTVVLHRPHPVPAVVEAKPAASPAAIHEDVVAVQTNAAEEVVESGRVLRSGDRLLVTIHAPPEPFNSQHVVDEQGRINLPYIGAVSIAGKSCAVAQQEIERKYVAEKYYKTVTVIIVPPESEYTVSGEVIRPGPYPLTRNLTLLQALSRAGRITEYGDPNRAILIRGSTRMDISVKEIREGKRKDIVIVPGDVIEVPKTWY
jgi:polysaccharide export outer membrane protein